MLDSFVPKMYGLHE